MYKLEANVSIYKLDVNLPNRKTIKIEVNLSIYKLDVNLPNRATIEIKAKLTPKRNICTTDAFELTL